MLRDLLLVVLAVPFTGVLAGSLYRSLTTGKAVLTGRGLRRDVSYERDVTPIRFWIVVFCRLIMAIAVPAVVVALIVRSRSG